MDVQVAASVLLPISQQYPHMVQMVLALRDGQSMLLTVETAGGGVRGMNVRRLYQRRRGQRDVRAGSGWPLQLAVHRQPHAGVSLLVELRERSDDEQLEQARVQQYRGGREGQRARRA